ncbi:dihydroxyacetone kinase phosphoryl donor subunit DhaM [Microbacterium binotii]|uniref:dihydroxyacetone kinase phosphoryl donor subunit DhaM n=1 Tax=Microbacterium binotii TaxID=462710 RepID=UPI001F2356BA|nr:dihydroxyacetone kinase phosphoryl donor subunit DhaM [Microbacterium binotii]UIN29745.1 HPr family phosphocarrier protein [Microbacterium binotii]
MIGFVVVSHSRPLAEAAVALATQMVAEGPPPIEIAAGSADGGFGTDAAAIAASIDRLDATEDVVVLMDLGSAVLSAEMALEFVEHPERVHLSSAPFVEGLVAAVVLAATGADWTSIHAELGGAYAQKARHLETGSGEPTPAPSPPAPESTSAEDEASFEAVVVNPSGLHARPAATFVKTAAKFDALVEIENVDAGSGPVSAASLLALIALGIGRGARIRVRARGREAQPAIDALRALVEDGFGEV